MFHTELPELQQALTECFAVLGKTFSKDALPWWAKALKNYSIADIKSALTDYAMRAEYPPKPKNLLEALAGSSNAGKVRVQCCFEADGSRCPLVGHYELNEGKFTGMRLCGEHHNLRGPENFRASIAFMHMALDGRMPKHEHANDRMMREFNAGTRAPKAALSGALTNSVDKVVATASRVRLDGPATPAASDAA